MQPVYNRILPLLLFFPLCLTAQIDSEMDQQKDFLQDGIYLIQETYMEKPDGLAGDGSSFIPYDHRFLDENSKDQPTYLKVSTKKFVPLELQERPLKLRDTEGKHKLILSLNGSSRSTLSSFTEANVDQRIAIVIRSKAVTMHKVREKLDEGRIQITRCTDNACEYLFTELKDNIKG